MPRGRLIYPFRVTIARLDTEAMAEAPEDSDLASSYDDDFREPVAVPPASGSAIVKPQRLETTVELLAQVEAERQNELAAALTGRDPRNRMTLIFHFRDLERVGMVDATSGRPALRGPADRLAKISHPRTGVLIEEFPAEPGFYATEVRSLGFGLGPSRNLLLVVFESRDQSSAGA